MRTPRFPFTPFPDGMFAVLFSHEVKQKQVVPLIFMGEKLVLFRTETGELGAIGSYCPHLGADLAFGKIIKETLQCPFHGIRFSVKGRCNAKNRAGEEGKYHLKSWQVTEKLGLIFITYNPTHNNLNLRLPEWNLHRWGKPIQHCFKIKSHPQEILENSVDPIHFFQVHNYQRVINSKPFEILGSEFKIEYQLERSEGLLGTQKKIEIQLKIHAYGLGVSHVDILIPKYGMQAKQIVFPTPIDGEYIYLRALTSVKIMDKIPCVPRSLSPHFIRKLMANWLTKMAGNGFLKDFLPDLNIWEHKEYRSHPQYFVHDGEFDTYRNWASQFYRGDIKERPKKNTPAHGIMSQSEFGTRYSTIKSCNEL
jgi:nitrite reductase/ring-hydroxylating ferredoxin subunit